jgi:hypothetical protein
VDKGGYKVPSSQPGASVKARSPHEIISTKGLASGTYITDGGHTSLNLCPNILLTSLSTTSQRSSHPK